LRSELCERLETPGSLGSVRAPGRVTGSRDASFGPSFLGVEPTLLDRQTPRWLWSELCERLETGVAATVRAAGRVIGSRDQSTARRPGG
jgi:hypothetical protein